MSTIIHEFYDAFTKMDAKKMSSCYHPEAIFYDHAFGQLDSGRVKAMWQMLVASQQGKNFRIEYRDVSVDGNYGKAHWEAHYTFSQTGRRVHNIIEGEFELKDNQIYRHTDHFDIHKWAGMALGWKGKLFGGTTFFKKQVQKQTTTTLNKWIQRN